VRPTNCASRGRKCCQGARWTLPRRGPSRTRLNRGGKGPTWPSGMVLHQSGCFNRWNWSTPMFWRRDLVVVFLGGFGFEGYGLFSFRCMLGWDAAIRGSGLRRGAARVWAQFVKGRPTRAAACAHVHKGSYVGCDAQSAYSANAGLEVPNWSHHRIKDRARKKNQKIIVRPARGALPQIRSRCLCSRHPCARCPLNLSAKKISTSAQLGMPKLSVRAGSGMTVARFEGHRFFPSVVRA